MFLKFQQPPDERHQEQGKEWILRMNAQEWERHHGGRDASSRGKEPDVNGPRPVDPGAEAATECLQSASPPIRIEIETGIRTGAGPPI
jgi:hypothetical protein